MMTQALDSGIKVVPPPIDYPEHPAYRSLGVRSRYDDAEVSRLIDMIDAALLALDRLPEKEAVRAAFARDVDPQLEKLARLLREGAPDAEMRNLFEVILAGARESVLADALDLSRRSLYKPSREHSADVERRLGEMHQQGFAKFAFRPELHEKFKDICRGQIESLRIEAKKGPGRLNRSLPMFGALGRSLRALMKETELLTVASEYRNLPMELAYCSIDYSHPGQRWYRDCYADVGIPTTKTAYMHYDCGELWLKGIMYLTPVSPNNGAFSFIAGSHKWPRSRFLSYIYKDLDNRYDVVFKHLVPEKDVVYYRPRFQVLEERRRLLCMPKRFQGSSHFGDDIVDGSGLSEFLLKNEVEIRDESPTCVLFDGAHGIHRGALIRTGERVALQLGINVREDISPLKRGLRKARRMAGRIRRGQNPF